MTDRRLMSALLALAVVAGAAGAVTNGAWLVSAAPAATTEIPRAKGPRYNGKSLQRAINVLQGAAGLVGGNKSENAGQEPAPDAKPATRDLRPETSRVPETGVAPPAAPESPPAVRQERPDQGPAPAPRAKERPPSERPVIVRNESLWPSRPRA